MLLYIGQISLTCLQVILGVLALSSYSFHLPDCFGDEDCGHADSHTYISLTFKLGFRIYIGILARLFPGNTTDTFFS